MNGGKHGNGKPRKEVRNYKGIANKIQEVEERISGVEDTLEEIDTTIKGNPKHKKIS